MKSLEFNHEFYLQAFMKTAQYLAGLTTYEDVWSHVGDVMLKLYAAGLAGFARRLPDGEIEFHHVAATEGFPLDCTCREDVRQCIREVLDTGFISSCSQVSEDLCTIVFLPINLGNDTSQAMIVGHADFNRISNDVLNVYLAIAGLAGSIITKLTSELELKKRTEELSEANEELTNYSERLERINQELEEFAFVASHDLQEPLRKIQIFGDRLQAGHGAALGPEGKDFLDRMVKSANRMSALLKSLRAYSRVASAIFPFRPTDLSQAAHEAVSDLEIVIEKTGGQVEIGKLPTIVADSIQMRELFQNLIANSLKYCREYEKPVIRIEGLARDDKCRIYVHDNGMGFEMIHLERIFKPFQRLHGNGMFEGTGIGLAVCRKIVERHGGNITATSIPGQGTTFIVTLPVSQG